MYIFWEIDFKSKKKKWRTWTRYENIKKIIWFCGKWEGWNWWWVNAVKIGEIVHQEIIVNFGWEGSDNGINIPEINLTKLKNQRRTLQIMVKQIKERNLHKINLPFKNPRIVKNKQW